MLLFLGDQEVVAPTLSQGGGSVRLPALRVLKQSVETAQGNSLLKG